MASSISPESILAAPGSSQPHGSLRVRSSKRSSSQARPNNTARARVGAASLAQRAPVRIHTVQSCHHAERAGIALGAAPGVATRAATRPKNAGFQAPKSEDASCTQLRVLHALSHYVCHGYVMSEAPLHTHCGHPCAQGHASAGRMSGRQRQGCSTNSEHLKCHQRSTSASGSQICACQLLIHVEGAAALLRWQRHASGRSVTLGTRMPAVGVQWCFRHHIPMTHIVRQRMQHAQLCARSVLAGRGLETRNFRTCCHAGGHPGRSTQRYPGAFGMMAAVHCVYAYRGKLGQ